MEYFIEEYMERQINKGFQIMILRGIILIGFGLTILIFAIYGYFKGTALNTLLTISILPFGAFILGSIYVYSSSQIKQKLIKRIYLNTNDIKFQVFNSSDFIVIDLNNKFSIKMYSDIAIKYFFDWGHSGIAFYSFNVKGKSYIIKHNQRSYYLKPSLFENEKKINELIDHLKK